MSRNVPKNCQHCYFYNLEEHKCKRMNVPVCNVASCFSWRPRLDVVLAGKGVEFVKYDEYEIEGDRNES